MEEWVDTDASRVASVAFLPPCRNLTSSHVCRDCCVTAPWAAEWRLPPLVAAHARRLVRYRVDSAPIVRCYDVLPPPVDMYIEQEWDPAAPLKVICVTNLHTVLRGLSDELTTWLLGSLASAEYVPFDRDARVPLIGLDVEYVTYTREHAAPLKVMHTMQLCYEGRVLILHAPEGWDRANLFHSPGYLWWMFAGGRDLMYAHYSLSVPVNTNTPSDSALHDSVHETLPMWLFVGAGLHADAQFMERSLGDRMAIPLNAYIDLTWPALMPDFMLEGGYTSLGLHNALQECIGGWWTKSSEIARSNWGDRELSMEQIKYATLDAWASVVVGAEAMRSYAARTHGCCSKFPDCVPHAMHAAFSARCEILCNYNRSAADALATMLVTVQPTADSAPAFLAYVIRRMLGMHSTHGCCASISSIGSWLHAMEARNRAIADALRAIVGSSLSHKLSRLEAHGVYMYRNSCGQLYLSLEAPAPGSST